MNKIIISVIAVVTGATDLSAIRSDHELSPIRSDRRRPTGLGQLGVVEHVPSQDFCEKGFTFNQDACACFEDRQCRIGCPGGKNNPFRCGCITNAEYASIFNHGLGSNCLDFEVDRVSSQD